jgi:hypothetical protein
MEARERDELARRFTYEAYKDSCIRTARKIAAAHPDCRMCQTIAAEGGFGPSHDASERCGSGRREHCTCPICWG